MHSKSRRGASRATGRSCSTTTIICSASPLSHSIGNRLRDDALERIVVERVAWPRWSPAREGSRRILPRGPEQSAQRPIATAVLHVSGFSRTSADPCPGQRMYRQDGTNVRTIRKHAVGIVKWEVRANTFGHPRKRRRREIWGKPSKGFEFST